MPTAITVAEAIDQYVRGLEADRSHGYARGVASTLKPIRQAYGSMQVKNLNSSHLEAVWREWGQGRGILTPANQDSTLNRKRTNITTWLRYCNRKGWTRRTHEELLSDVRARKATRKVYTYLEPEQIVQFLEATDHPRDRMFHALAIHTGLRQGEIVTLRVRDVNLLRSNLHVLRHKTHVEDVLPITAELEQELRTWLTWYADKLDRPLRPEDYLLPAKDNPCVANNGGLIHRGDLSVPLHPERHMLVDNRRLQRILKDMGIPDTKQEGLHTIRRSVARLLYMHILRTESRDHALSIVQATLGHSSPAMTQRYIGVDYFQQQRNELLAGKSFLSDLLPKAEGNVISLDARRHS